MEPLTKQIAQARAELKAANAAVAAALREADEALGRTGVPDRPAEWKLRGAESRRRAAAARLTRRLDTAALLGIASPLANLSHTMAKARIDWTAAWVDLCPNSTDARAAHERALADLAAEGTR